MGRVVRNMSRFAPIEVRTILKRGKRVLKTPTTDIIVSPQAHEYGRILVITPKRIGKASQRNKVRRRIKALFLSKNSMNVALIASPLLKKRASMHRLMC